MKTRPASNNPDRSVHLHIEAHNIEQDEYKVFQRLFKGRSEIIPFQGKKSLKSASQAFIQTYPHYLFIIDRDYESDDKAEECWANFPKKPLLIWRKRMIENYFLKPDWLAETSHFKKRKETQETIEKYLVDKANERLLMDAFLYVFHQQDEQLKRSFLEHPPANKFSETFQTLSELEHFIESTLKSAGANATQAYKQCCKNFERDLLNHLTQLTGVTIKTTLDPLPLLEYGKGRWLELMEGKPLWNGLWSHYGIKSSKLLEELFSCEATFYPKDFIELRDKVLEHKRK
jgi:hypothetical protein